MTWRETEVALKNNMHPQSNKYSNTNLVLFLPPAYLLITAGAVVGLGGLQSDKLLLRCPASWNVECAAPAVDGEATAPENTAARVTDLVHRSQHTQDRTQA